MMSIGLAAVLAVAASQVPVPSTAPAVPPVDPADLPAWLGMALTVWAMAALVAARGLGAFRRPGISGPERLPPDDSGWTVLGIMGGGIASLVVGTMFANGLVGTAQRILHAHPSPDVKNLLISCLAEAFTVAAVLAMVWELWSTRGAGLRLIGLNPRLLPNAIVGGTAALFIVFPLIQLSGMCVMKVYRWLHLTQAKPHPVLKMLRTNHSPGLAIAAVLTASVVAPVTEELAFRGLLQTMLGRLFNWSADLLGVPQPPPPPAAEGTPVTPPTGEPIPLPYAVQPGRKAVSPLRPIARWLAVVVTSLAFAAIHGEPAFLAPIFVLSLGLGYVYERSGNLYMNIVTHSLFNASQIALFLTIGN